jgi:hypothetical protein
MSNTEIFTAAMIAMRNKKQVETSHNVGCYYCLQIFPATDVQEYTDNGNTAICPHCHVDSIIPEKAVQTLTESTLKEMHDYWFN